MQSIDGDTITSKAGDKAVVRDRKDEAATAKSPSQAHGEQALNL